LRQTFAALTPSTPSIATCTKLGLKESSDVATMMGLTAPAGTSPKAHRAPAEPRVAKADARPAMAPAHDALCIVMEENGPRAMRVHQIHLARLMMSGEKA